jgi:hypothetical protein
MENAYFLTRQAYSVPEWTTRPVVMVLIALIVITLMLSILGILRARRHPAAPATTEADQSNPGMAVILTFLAVLLGVYGLFATQDWPAGAAFFPLAIGFPTLGLALVAFAGDARAVALALRAGTGHLGGRVTALFPGKRELVSAFRVLAIFLAIFVGALLFGQKVTLVTFVILYLWLQASAPWWLTLVYAAVIYIVLEGLFGEIANVIWHRSLLLG